MVVESPNEPSRDEQIALITGQSARISALVAESTALEARIGDLKRRLGLNSSNSGKPPSSDGLKKPARVRSLRETSERKPGGQKGHEGQTLRRSAEPDVVEDHFPAACGECGAALTPDASAGHAAMKLRQKNSGGFRSLAGAAQFATIRSFIATGKKQGWKIVDALADDRQSLAKSLRLV